MVTAAPPRGGGILHKGQPRGASRSPARLDVAGGGLVLADVHVIVERHRQQLVSRIPGHDPHRAPVVRRPDDVSARPWICSGLIRSVTSTRASTAWRRSRCRPAAVLESAFGRQLGRDLAEELGLELGQVRNRARHPARGVMLGQAIGGEHEREHLGAGLPVAGVVGVLRARWNSCGWGSCSCAYSGLSNGDSCGS